jgi:O-antigen/teichoic acid export membrane protein
MPLSLKGEAGLLARHSTVFGLGNLANQIVSFLLLPIYTRFLTPHDYGIKELVGLTTDVMGVLLAMTIASAVQRFYFEYEETADRNEVISTAIIMIGGAGLIAISCLFFTTGTMARYILNDIRLAYFFQISFVSMLFQSVNGVGLDYLRANQKSTAFVALSFGKMVVGISLNIIFICFMGLGVLGILLTTLITTLLLFAVLIVPLLQKTGARFSWKKLREMVRFGLPLTVSQLGAFIVHLSDRFFIKAYWSVAAAGLYSLGYRFGTLPGTFISVPFNQTWLPRRFEMFKAENSERVFGKIFTYYLALLIFCGLGVAVLTKDVLMIMADRAFWSAYKIVPIIILANIIYNLSPHLSMGLLISKNTKYLAMIDGSNGALVLFLNLVLIRAYGAYGAAVATLIAFVYKISLIYYFSSKYYEIHFEIRRIVKLFLGAAAIFGIAMMLHFESIWVSLLVKSVVVLLYPLLLVLMRFASDEEKRQLAEWWTLRVRPFMERFAIHT